MWHAKGALLNKTGKETQFKFYKVMAMPALLYGSETWVINQRHCNSIIDAAMTYLRSVAQLTDFEMITSGKS